MIMFPRVWNICYNEEVIFMKELIKGLVWTYVVLTACVAYLTKLGCDRKPECKEVLNRNKWATFKALLIWPTYIHISFKKAFR